MASFDDAIPTLLAREGGAKVTEIPGDPGGLTKYGISQRAYPNLNIRALTEDGAKQLYQADYWDRVHGNEIHSQPVAEAVFDAGVNHGPGTAIRWLQEVTGVGQDGILGPISLASLNAMQEAQILPAFRLKRIANYYAQVKANPSKAQFLLGWIGRGLEA